MVPSMPHLSRQSHGPCGCAYPYLLRGNASLSSLVALKGGEKTNHPFLSLIRNQLELVICEVMFQWVPGHVGLIGNERTDQAAREAAL